MNSSPRADRWGASANKRHKCGKAALQHAPVEALNGAMGAIKALLHVAEAAADAGEAALSLPESSTVIQ